MRVDGDGMMVGNIFLVSRLSWILLERNQGGISLETVQEIALETFQVISPVFVEHAFVALVRCQQ